VIDYEIDYFGKLNRGFEWKVYSHDDPSDLLARLRLRGFAIGEEEGPNDPRFGGVAASPASTTTGRVTNAPVRDDSGIADFLALEPAIWERSRTTPEFLLASINDPSGPDLAFVAYSKQRPIGFGRVTTSLESPLAGLWGGSVLPDFRGAEFTERRATKR
jgi:hypothetical protein